MRKESGAARKYILSLQLFLKLKIDKRLQIGSDKLIDDKDAEYHKKQLYILWKQGKINAIPLFYSGG